MSHTQGPWFVQDSRVRSRFTGGTVCDCRYKNGVADAALIALAPEMLEALEEALIALEGGPNTVGLHLQINRVIAKAKGPAIAKAEALRKE